ncbi:MAG TPA: GspMb/PilO family protein [Candidatus Acidoferrum sp.]|jgi:Tfp pilus assembly protein PilO
MRRDFTFEKRAVYGGLALLLAADVALAVYTWNLTSATKVQQNLLTLTRNRDLLRADIKRGEGIRDKIPAIQKDCDQFETSLFPGSIGYSAVTAELGELASKAGLQIDNRAFHQNAVAGRNLTEVSMDTSVTGSYTSVVKFLNGLQRSTNVYEIEGLSAKGDAQSQTSRGPVRVLLHIKTYFRVT